MKETKGKQTSKVSLQARSLIKGTLAVAKEMDKKIRPITKRI